MLARIKNDQNIFEALMQSNYSRFKQFYLTATRVSFGSVAAADQQYLSVCFPVSGHSNSQY